VTKKLKLMPDYDCFPLWWIDHPAGKIAVEPDEVPLAPETRARLERWAQAFDDQLDRANPPASRFDKADWARFDEEGLAIWGLLQRELGPGWEVFYWKLMKP
jgi:hypothetical protein